jgi:GNAT superfamily N-acetyltransferase
VVATLAEAFATDPLLAFLFEDPARRPSLLAAFFANRLAGGRGFDEVVVPADADGGRTCAAVWVPPSGPDEPGPDFAAVGAGNMALLGEEWAVERLAPLAPLMEAHPVTPHWYLAFVGTVASARGRGLASACISEVTRRCDATGHGAYLESSDPANVPLYERHGFSVTSEVTIPGGPTVPLMWRDPR